MSHQVTPRRRNATFQRPTALALFMKRPLVRWTLLGDERTESVAYSEWMVMIPRHEVKSQDSHRLKHKFWLLTSYHRFVELQIWILWSFLDSSWAMPFSPTRWMIEKYSPCDEDRVLSIAWDGQSSLSSWQETRFLHGVPLVLVVSAVVETTYFVHEHVATEKIWVQYPYAPWCCNEY